MADFKERIIGAAKLDVKTYEEVEADVNALGQAMLVVVMSSVAAGIGQIGRGGIGGIFLGVIAALVGWFVWAFIIFIIGTKLLPEPNTKSDVGELLRTLGFASGPGIIRFFCFIPLLGWLINIAAAIWMLVAMIIAVRQALDYTSTGRAVLVCFIGWIAMLVVAIFFAMVIGTGKAVVF